MNCEITRLTNPSDGNISSYTDNLGGEQYNYTWNQGGSPGDFVTFDYQLKNKSFVSVNYDEYDTATVTITLVSTAVPEFKDYVYMLTLLIIFFLIFSFVAGPNKKYLNN